MPPCACGLKRLRQHEVRAPDFRCLRRLFRLCELAGEIDCDRAVAIVGPLREGHAESVSDYVTLIPMFDRRAVERYPRVVNGLNVLAARGGNDDSAAGEGMPN